MSDRVTLAAHAVRDTTSGEETGAACYTRARVLALVRQRKRRRVLNVTFGIPLAAILVGSVAWAASGQHLTAMVHDISAALTRTVGTPPKASSGAGARQRAAQSAAADSRQQRADVSAAIAADVPPESPPSVIAPESSAKRSASTAIAPLLRARSTPRDTEVTERELLLYERAHRSHFIDANWVAALAAWDEYLGELPRGRFALEARYNRALCLVRLGRTEQALKALRPFAQGSFGNYRQGEARKLIEQIEQSAH